MSAASPIHGTARQRGFSLVELGIVVAVISILVVGYILGAGFRNAARVSNTVRQIVDIQKAAYAYSSRYNHGLDYSAISNAELTVGRGGTNPLYAAKLETAWGGPVTVAPHVTAPGRLDPTYFDLTIKVPSINDKNDLRASIKNIGEDISPNDSFTVVLKLRGRPEGM